MTPSNSFTSSSSIPSSSIPSPAIPAAANNSLHTVNTCGIAKGLFAVVLFAMTVPMTKLALPLFSPELIAASRGTIAGLLALFVININGWSLPNKKVLAWLALAGTGIVIGFPYLLSYSLVNLSAANMGVVLAGLPLMTSLFAVVIIGERHNRSFWIASGFGATLLASYFINGAATSGWNLETVLILLCVLAFGGLGYSAGAKAAKNIGGWQTICWMLVLYLPFSAVAFGYYAGDEIFIINVTQAMNNPEAPYRFWLPILGLVYLAVISQWWGFRFWYQAMAEAGAGRISQIQLLQPFFTLVFAVVFLGEAFELSQVVFAGLIVLAVFSALRSKG